PGQAIAIPAPGYPLIEPLAALARATTVTYRWHYLHPHGWWADTNAIAGLARRRAFGVFALVNPENPTGIYTDAQTRQAVLDAVANAGAALIADEVFNPFALDGQPTTLAGEDQVVVFTLGGLSKSLCAPQMKLAWIRLSGPPPATKPIRELLDQIADTLLPVSSPVALALPDLLDLSDAVIPHTRHRLATNLATARRVLDQAPYRVRRCEGGWSVIVDAPRYVDGDDLPIRLMREAHLAVHPGWFYDLPDDAALVLSLLPHPDQFATSCHNLRAAIDAWAP
ncbi:MAG: pyridoxal phosphate-dependent aminotransferase, partial [Bifidobacteriaceae bacterium]|nr:pyridoxal phosphate-dependent aminotransferase [Bifidobacteriaceae bacterium]